MDNIITKFINFAELPLVIEPAKRKMSLAELVDTLRSRNVYFKENLLKHGGLLLRNFPIHNEKDFVEVIKSLQTGNFIDYIGGDSPRNKIYEGVYTSTEAPPSIKLPLHNELSYVKNYPSHIYFYCDVAPIANGETIVSDARKIYRAIDPEVRSRFEKLGIQYVSCYPYKSPFMNYINKSHKSWVNVFETDDKQEVERKCLENEISFKWNQNDWIQISQNRPAIITHPQTQEKVWFNQAHHYDFNPKFLGLWRYLGAQVLYSRKHMRLHEVYYSDSSKIARQDIYHVLDVLDQQSVYFPWQKGDVLVLDNVLAMHGRAAFKGKRRVLTAMTG